MERCRIPLLASSMSCRVAAEIQTWEGGDDESGKGEPSREVQDGLLSSSSDVREGVLERDDGACRRPLVVI